MALVIIDNIYKRKKVSKLAQCFSFFTPSEHAVTEKVPGRSCFFKLSDKDEKDVENDTKNDKENDK